MTNKFQKSITMTAAFDKRAPAPAKNYGIHGVNMNFTLTGELGCIDFIVCTNWYLPHVHKELAAKGRGEETFSPTPASVNYHSYTPTYEGEQPSRPKCPFLNDKLCYSGGSYIKAEELFNELLEKGSGGVWKALEKLYDEWLKDEKGG